MRTRILFAHAAMEVFERLQALLASHQARYRLIEHPAAGRSVEVAAIRGTAVSQGAKALVCRVKLSSNQRRNVLAVFRPTARPTSPPSPAPPAARRPRSPRRTWRAS